MNSLSLTSRAGVLTRREHGSGRRITTTGLLVIRVQLPLSIVLISNLSSFIERVDCSE